MFNQVIEKTQFTSSESYQLIKDEHLASVVITNQVLAGSRVLMSSYQQVVFSECSFYAVEFQGVIFRNCVFENCNFSFSHIKNCKFVNCSFHNCNWTASSTMKNVYEDCDLDSHLDEHSMEGGNSCVNSKDSFTTDIYITLAA